MEQQLQQLTIGKVVVGATVVALLYYMLLYNDGSALQASITSTQAEIQTKEQELQVIKKAIEDAERYQQTKNALGAEMGSVLKAVPEKLSHAEIMKLISTEANSIGVNISGLVPGAATQQFSQSPNEPKPFYEPVVVNVTLEGTYTNLMLFLSAMTKSDKIINAASLNLENKSQNVLDDSSNTTLRLVSEFRAYRFLPSKEGAQQ